MSLIGMIRLRKSRGVSVKDLSIGTGISSHSIKNIESGFTSRPRKSTLNKIANFFEVEVSDLYSYKC